MHGAEPTPKIKRGSVFFFHRERKIGVIRGSRHPERGASSQEIRPSENRRPHTMHQRVLCFVNRAMNDRRSGHGFNLTRLNGIDYSLAETVSRRSCVGRPLAAQLESIPEPRRRRERHSGSAWRSTECSSHDEHPRLRRDSLCSTIFS